MPALYVVGSGLTGQLRARVRSALVELAGDGPRTVEQLDAYGTCYGYQSIGGHWSSHVMTDWLPSVYDVRERNRVVALLPTLEQTTELEQTATLARTDYGWAGELTIATDRDVVLRDLAIASAYHKALCQPDHGWHLGRCAEEYCRGQDWWPDPARTSIGSAVPLRGGQGWLVRVPNKIHDFGWVLVGPLDY